MGVRMGARNYARVGVNHVACACVYQCLCMCMCVCVCVCAALAPYIEEKNRRRDVKKSSGSLIRAQHTAPQQNDRNINVDAATGQLTAGYFITWLEDNRPDEYAAFTAAAHSLKLPYATYNSLRAEGRLPQPRPAPAAAENGSDFDPSADTSESDSDADADAPAAPQQPATAEAGGAGASVAGPSRLTGSRRGAVPQIAYGVGRDLPLTLDAVRADPSRLPHLSAEELRQVALQACKLRLPADFSHDALLEAVTSHAQRKASQGSYELLGELSCVAGAHAVLGHCTTPSTCPPLFSACPCSAAQHYSSLFMFHLWVCACVSVRVSAGETGEENALVLYTGGAPVCTIPYPLPAVRTSARTQLITSLKGWVSSRGEQAKAHVKLLITQVATKLNEEACDRAQAGGEQGTGWHDAALARFMERVQKDASGGALQTQEPRAVVGPLGAGNGEQQGGEQQGYGQGLGQGADTGRDRVQTQGQGAPMQQTAAEYSLIDALWSQFSATAAMPAVPQTQPLAQANAPAANTTVQHTDAAQTLTQLLLQAGQSQVQPQHTLVAQALLAPPQALVVSPHTSEHVTCTHTHC